MSAKASSMDIIRRIAAGYAVVLGIVTVLNYIPGLTDAQGRAFGVFALDIYDDALHLGSALWAAVSAYLSRGAARKFLQIFGVLYCLDGLMGLAFGSGYLDLGILIYGVVQQPFVFKVMANAPHILLGGFAAWAGFVLAERG